MTQGTPKPSKPAIVVIPGGACPVVFYHDLVSSLKKHGYEAETHNLRSYTDNPKHSEPQGLAEDAAYLHAKIEALAAQGKDVVVVGHSYGGLVTTDAAHGLSKAERAQAGKRGGVVRIIYLSCIVGAVGSSSAETCADRLPNFDFLEPADEVCVSTLHTLRVVSMIRKLFDLADAFPKTRTIISCNRTRRRRRSSSAICHWSRVNNGFQSRGTTQCVHLAIRFSMPRICKIQ